MFENTKAWFNYKEKNGASCEMFRLEQLVYFM